VIAYSIGRKAAGGGRKAGGSLQLCKPAARVRAECLPEIGRSFDGGMREFTLSPTRALIADQ
jgi:hypothetical protein